MTDVVILISANAEWRVVREENPHAHFEKSPFGEYFSDRLAGQEVIFLHGGWGKVSAAASTQYAIDRWQPSFLVNLGTCGGFVGRIQRGTLLLVTRTLIYDIIEQMGDPQEAIEHYACDLDLSFIRPPYPQPVEPGLLVSADRDICPADIPGLVQTFGANAADWESGAIAWTARRSAVPCLILRGVSDLVGAEGGEAYQALEVFQNGTRQVMAPMLRALPDWLAAFNR
jgi:adenosylhomocysteine nucleosidase